MVNEVKKNEKYETIEVTNVFESNAIINPVTMMIEFINAFIAY